MVVSSAVVEHAEQLGHSVSLITLENFTALFHGTYITLENANPQQVADIQKMVAAELLVFVVPTYHSGIPSPLKNFFDSLKCKEAYAHKIIGVISSNESNRDFGARQTAQVLNGILAYNKLISFVVPIVPIIDFNDIDHERIRSFVEYCCAF